MTLLVTVIPPANVARAESDRVSVVRGVECGLHRRVAVRAADAQDLPLSDDDAGAAATSTAADITAATPISAAAVRFEWSKVLDI